MMPVVKICCIASIEEARLALAAGAGALGLVSIMPSGPGVIDDERIAEIAAAVHPADTFLLTAHTDAEAIAAQQRAAGTTTLQLVDQVPHAELRRLRKLRPGVRLVQVVHVLGQESVDEAAAAAPWVDAILLDSGNPNAAVKELGGTGRVHDWALSRCIRDTLAPLPVFLAGGLRADNVAEAMCSVRPHGLDLCSSVRHQGRLDPARLAAVMAAVMAAAAVAGYQA
jgi:phosphoribosylanthranilate isomerase